MSNEKIEKTKYPIIPPALPLWQFILHGIVLAIGWIGYFYFFWRGVINGNRETLGIIAIFILSSAIIICLLNYIWVHHNLSIYKKKGPRTHTPVFPENYEYDFFKKPINADWGKLKKAHLITIKITPEGKFYE